MSRLSDSYPHSFFTGLLEIGDQILKIDEQKVCSSRIPSCYFVSIHRVVLFFILVELFCYFVISCLKLTWLAVSVLFYISLFVSSHHLL